MAEPERIYEPDESLPSRQETGGEPYILHRAAEPVSLEGDARELMADVGDMLRGELQLARQEMRADLKAVTTATAWLTVGSTALFLGVTYLLLAAIFAIASTLTLGLGALIIGGAVFIVGAICSWIGWNSFKSVNPLPEQTLEAVREDVQWLRNRTR